MVKGGRKKAETRPKSPAQKEICFAIMPFGDWYDEYFARIYCPAIEEAGLEPHRADDLYRPSTITNDIWSYTQRAALILADLSEKNPNVFYELGLAHALAKPAILIAQSIDAIPFDLRALRIILYDKNDPLWGELLREKIVKAINETIASPKDAILPAFLSVKASPKTPAISEQEKVLLELRREIDLLRNEVISDKSRDARPARTSPSIGIIRPQEATDLIRRYLDRGMPEPEIIARVTERGAPPQWVVQKIAAESSARTQASAAETKAAEAELKREQQEVKPE